MVYMTVVAHTISFPGTSEKHLDLKAGYGWTK